MNEQVKGDAKVQKPPHEMVLESSLSKAGKVKALDTLEQDARQLAEASSEGMTGGERNKLHEVLIAKDTLDLAPAAGAQKDGGPRQRGAGH